MTTTINNNEVSSVSNFTNEFGHNKSKFVINFTRYKGMRKDLYKQSFNKIKIDLVGIQSAELGGADLRQTKPINQKDNRENHNSRAKAIKAVISNPVAFFTGIAMVNDKTSITVDMAVNENQRVAIITESTVGVKKSNKVVVAFDKVDITEHGFVFNSKTFGITTEQASAATIKNATKTDEMKAEQDEDQRAFALALELIENQKFAEKVAKHLGKLQAQAEELESLSEARTKPTTQFEEEFAAYVASQNTKNMKAIVEASQSAPTTCEEVAPTIATKTDDQAAFDDEVKTVSRKVLALALSQEELEEQEREREEIEAEARRAALMQRRRDQNKREGVGAALVQELAQKRMEVEEHDMIEAYQIDQIHEYGSVIGRARETFY